MIVQNILYPSVRASALGPGALTQDSAARKPWQVPRTCPWGSTIFRRDKPFGTRDVWKSLDSFFKNVEQNYFKKSYRAK